MSPPIWILSVPLGYVNVMWPRFLSVFLTARAGIELDPTNPRKQVEGGEVASKDDGGYIARAYSAHQNGWESMNLWVAAVLLAFVTGVDEDKMNAVAWVWLISRIMLVREDGSHQIRSANRLGKEKK
eukprot:jgi/Undpi1/3633/HiC_scaffold_16.g07003.m1